MSHQYPYAQNPPYTYYQQRPPNSLPYQYQQQSAGPPQPPWQAAPSAPPQPQWQSSWPGPNSSSTEPPSNPYSQSYYPSLYGPIHPPATSTPSPRPFSQAGNTAGHFQRPYSSQDTANWGVKYNQAQEQSQYEESSRPPLPPRPPSTNQVSPVSINSFGPSGQPWWNTATYVHGQAPDPVPPPPPPRPTEYQQQIADQYTPNDWPHQRYSQRPPSHHYVPSVSSAWNGTDNVSEAIQQPDPPAAPMWDWQGEQPLVSPEEPQHTNWSGSATKPTQQHAPSAGSTWNYQSAESAQGVESTISPDSLPTVSAVMAGPSNWEQLTPTDHTEPDVLPEPADPQPNLGTGSLHHTPTLTKSGDNSVATMPAELPTAEPRPRSASALVTDSTVDQQKTADVQPGSATQANLTRQESWSTIGANESVQRRGTIDSVIDAWQVPRKQHTIQPLKLVHGISTPERPISPPSLTQSPSHATLTSPARAKGSLVSDPQHAVRAVTSGESYQGLDPEYHSSLARYTNMLKRESMAATDEAKYNVFQSFMKRELRIRQILYGIEQETISMHSSAVAKLDTTANFASQPPASVNANDTEEITRTPSAIARKSLRSASTEERLSAGNRIITTAVAPISAMEDATGAALAAQAMQNVFSDTPATVSSKTQDSLGTAEQSADNRSVQTASILGHTSTAAATEVLQSSINSPTTTTQVGHPVPDVFNGRPPVSGSAKTTDPSLTNSNDDSFVVVDHDADDEAYSPGGRPLLKKHMRTDSKPLLKTNEQSSGGVLGVSSPSENAPMLIEDYAVINSPSADAPIVVDATDNSHQAQDVAGTNASVPGAADFEPPRPVYTPFRYNETLGQNPPAPSDRPADEAYQSLRHQASESGRMLKHELPSGSGAPMSLESTELSRGGHQETFLGLIRTQSQAHHKNRSKRSMTSLRPGTAAAGDPVVTAYSSLQALLPLQKPVITVDGRVIAITTTVDSMSDDFGFIRETVVLWDRHNRENRSKRDKERDQRQEESERHLDELFNANEISYAELNTAEGEFKVAEAKLRYQEDQQELQSFIQSVYTTVTERLQQEIDRLTPQYVQATDLLDLDSHAVSQMLRADDGKISMASLMELVLHIFGKLEVRYQKMAEARFERERRRKRLELTVFYTNGNASGVMALEVDFANAEKLQVLHESQTKDARANKLMDIFDRATVRGLGDNQTYVDDLLIKITKFKDNLPDDDRQLPENIYTDGGIHRTLNTAQDVLNMLLEDSKMILLHSNTADQILNDADYAVSVAEARVAKENKSMFQKLEQDKAQEDAKLAQEVVVRMDGMAKAPEEAVHLIQNLLASVGKAPEHQERLRRSLAEAKKRNAAKASQPPD